MPRYQDLGPMPLVWLVYLLFLYLPLIFNSRISSSMIWGTIISTLVFLPLYFKAFSSDGRAALPWVGGILLLGMVTLPFTSGAMVFFIYAASFIAFAGIRPLPALTLIVIIAALETWLVVNWQSAVITTIIAVVVGLGNILAHRYMQRTAELKQSRDEVRRLATLAERERISRDLHDLLGHTLSVIAIKSELSGKLLDRGATDQARVHLRELEKVTRDALSQVRTAIVGFRSSGCGDEIEHVRPALEAVGCQLHVAMEDIALGDKGVNALALALREALMNVVKHAGASRCDVTITNGANEVTMTVADDGKAVNVVEGAGLTGMRERIEAVGGRVAIDRSSSGGLALQVTMPRVQEHPCQR